MSSKSPHRAQALYSQTSLEKALKKSLTIALGDFSHGENVKNLKCLPAYDTNDEYHSNYSLYSMQNQRKPYTPKFCTWPRHSKE